MKKYQKAKSLLGKDRLDIVVCVSMLCSIKHKQGKCKSIDDDSFIKELEENSENFKLVQR